jgi:single-strand DNA-binding protein
MLIGRLGADPEVRHFQNGGRIVNLRIATSEIRKDKYGNQEERTEWHSVVISNTALCDIVEKYLHKGDLVFIEGQLVTRKWQDRDGNDRYTTEVVVRPFNGNLVMLGSPKSKRGDSESKSYAQTQHIRDSSPSASNPHDFDDDIPF